MTDSVSITEKINQVKEEMKLSSLWKNEPPAWVKEFEKRNINSGEDFIEWLQFVYLPNRVQEAESNRLIYERNYIVPQAVRFFSSDIKKGKLLQLLIELDSLS
ncbi:MAG: YqcC family protein [Ferruginibacter sp.]